jgi:hypothetical protein
MLQQQAEESVQWHIESLLVKCHEGDHISLHQRGGREVLGHVAGHELHSRYDPLAHNVLQVLLRDLGRGPVLFCHVSGGKEKHCSLNLKNLSYFSFSLSFLRRKEEGKKTTTKLCEMT